MMRVLGLIAVLSLWGQASFSYSFDKNVPTDVKNQMIDDLNFITSVTGETQSPIHQQIYGLMNGTDYKNFFDTRVKAIGRHDCGDSRAVACVIPFIPNKMFITNNYIKFSHPAIARLMVVFHEARHTEAREGNWPHENCPRPFLDENGVPYRSIFTGSDLAGAAACDITPLGSYGSSAIMLKNISKFCTSCNEKVKMDAGIYADDQINRIISQSAKKQMIDDVFGN